MMYNAASQINYGIESSAAQDQHNISASTAYIAMRNEKQMVLDNYDHYLKRNNAIASDKGQQSKKSGSSYNVPNFMSGSTNRTNLKLESTSHSV